MHGPALILHDDEPTLTLVRGIVEAAGFDVRTAESALGVVLHDQGPAPRLVLLGLTAIDERDTEIFPVLRARWPLAQFVVLAPAAMRRRAAEALALGADACLPEPFYPGELAAIARRAAAAPRLPPGPPQPSTRTSPGGVEQLAAGVAHSIRNPLQILELQLGTAESEGEGKVDVSAMRAEMKRISGVVDGLTRFSGQRGLAFQPVDVRALVRHVFSDTKKAAAGHDIRVTDADGESAIVLGSNDLLRAGLEGLRARAVRLTRAGGTIHVRTRVAAGPPRTVEVTVTDGGPPMPPERLARLFEPYPDPASVQDGTGLELAGLAGVVRDHGGNVAAAAVPGGTAIVIELPAAVPPEAPGR